MQQTTQRETEVESNAPAGQRIAIVSFLFNWPSTGGGIVHTVELAQFLSRAGYEVQVFAPQCSEWRTGEVDASCPIAIESLPFDRDDWTLPEIKRRFRHAVDDFGPETVLITDSWNIKPHLFDALSHYRVLLRMQANECLCPLNNLRLLPPTGDGPGPRLCHNTQLADAESCRRCLIENAETSGALHRLERQLSGVGSTEYDDLLKRAFRESAAVLALNPEVAEALRPHCGRVEVVTWGMDPERFPSPIDEVDDPLSRHDGVFRILFAGLASESIKGAHVVREACNQLRTRRKRFELLLTDNRNGETPSHERWLGWQTQSQLPQWYHRTDVTVVPTIAPDGLSRTSVEAMAAGRPVVASRIGGLPFSVEDGRTGLLFAPGNAADLASQLERLIDDESLRTRLGQAGRREFERRFTWESVIEKQYRPLLENAVVEDHHTARRHPPASTSLNTQSHAEDVTSLAIRRLEIGPGQAPLAGFETLDMTGDATFRACWGEDRLTERVPVAAFDEIYASHVLEHVPWNATQRALADVYQLLKPGGRFEVWVPDFEYIIECYLRRTCGDDWRRDNPTGDPMQWVNGRLFTWGPGENNRHRACFDYRHLANCLRQVGFAEIERISRRTRGTSHGPIDLGVRCRRPEHDGLAIAAKANREAA